MMVGNPTASKARTVLLVRARLENIHSGDLPISKSGSAVYKPCLFGLAGKHCDSCDHDYS